MRYFSWNVLLLVAVVTLATIIIVLKFSGVAKNRFYNPYHQDELIKVKKAVNSHNYLYFTYGESLKYIRKYVICKTALDRFLICNYTARFKKITYYVVEYNAAKRVVAVLKVTELGNSESSRIIALRRNCKYVNVIVNRVEETEVNSSVIKPKTNGTLRVRALLGAIEGFCWTFIFSYLLSLLLLGDLVVFFLNSIYFSYILLFAAGVALLYYIFAILALKRKNSRILRGGVLEYEFL